MLDGLVSSMGGVMFSFDADGPLQIGE